MRHRKFRSPFLVLAALSTCALVACSADQSQSALTDKSLGAVDFALQLAPGVTLNTVTYTIVGPASFSKSGSFDVSQSTRIGALIGPIPAGQGYSITLAGTSVEGTSKCSGSAVFNVIAGQTTPVSVAFLCHEGARTGSALINGVLNICPTLDAVSANPAEAFVGTTIALSASAHDSDAGPVALSYAWNASSGSLANANTASPTFTCAVPGPVSLSVSAADGDPLATCADTRTITVQCTSTTSGAGGSSGAVSAGSSAGGAAAGGSSGAATGDSAGAPAAGSAGAPAGGSAGLPSGGSSGAATAGSSGTPAGGSGGAAAGSAGTGGAPGSGGSGGTAGSGAGTTLHLDVYRVGDGASSLVNTGNAVFVDEYTTDGSLVRSIAMPLAVNGANRRFVASGTATSEGLMTRSADGHFVLLTGYDAPLPTTGLVGTSGTAVPRVVGRISADGTVDTTTQVMDGLSGNNPRSVASSDGTQFWVTGASGGVRFLTLGNTSSTTTQVSSSAAVSNLRQVGIFGSQLYVSDSSGSAVRLGAVGSGLPTTAGQPISNIPGFPLTGSPYGFYFADLDSAVPGVDVLYVADDSTGLSKYSLVAGAWLANGTVGTAADAYRGLTASANAGTVTLFATRKGGSAAAGGGELVSLVDTSGYNGALAGTPTLLVAAATNTAFRGVAWAPNP
jgi:hypothetical protein